MALAGAGHASVRILTAKAVGYSDWLGTSFIARTLITFRSDTTVLNEQFDFFLFARSKNV